VKDCLDHIESGFSAGSSHRLELSNDMLVGSRSVVESKLTSDITLVTRSARPAGEPAPPGAEWALALERAAR
jgi:hypothetical protein